MQTENVPMMNDTPAGPTSEPDFTLLTKSREWRRLTDQQKRFVFDFLSTGDARHAIESAYPKATAASRRSLQYQVLRAEAIVEALDMWAWRDTPAARTTLVEIIREQLRAAVPGSVSAAKFAVQLERLLIGVQGTNKAHYVDSTEPEPTNKTGTAAPVFSVGMRVTERDAQGVEHIGIVKALDASGRPSDIEEVKS